ncbi:MAG: type II toxin-antitoxin system CcdA family antitoxin [Gammaproteobacteria bacterium]|nr:type II toxin-antitoxin system CcdA family antitoxin [Gammaproteobacteria bacterium]
MMSSLLAQTPKRATNVSLNPALLSEAKQLNINLSATLEKALREEVSVRKQALWLAENNAAIDAYNALTERECLFSDTYRAF